MPFSTEISGLLSSSVKNCIRYKIGLTEQFLSELYVEHGLEKNIAKTFEQKKQRNKSFTEYKLDMKYNNIQEFREQLFAHIVR